MFLPVDIGSLDVGLATWMWLVDVLAAPELNSNVLSDSGNLFPFLRCVFALLSPFCLHIFPLARAFVRPLSAILAFVTPSGSGALPLFHLYPLFWRTGVRCLPFDFAAVVVRLYAHPPHEFHARLVCAFPSVLSRLSSILCFGRSFSLSL